MNRASEQTLLMYRASMTQQKLRPPTIIKRIEILTRFAIFLGTTPLLEAELAQIRAFQSTFGHLAPASVNVYVRHLRALYAWAFDLEILPANTAARLAIPRVPKAVPHPTNTADLKVMLRCSTGALRTAYLLSAFVGLRCGEVTRLRYEDMDLDSSVPTALIDGKGGKQRRVPLLPQVVQELRVRSRGWVIVHDDGTPWTPQQLAHASHEFLRNVGLETTLHSCRAWFATTAGRLSKDPMLVRDLLGHDSVKTTETYLQTDILDAHARLGALNAVFADILYPAAVDASRLRAVAS